MCFLCMILFLKVVTILKINVQNQFYLFYKNRCFRQTIVVWLPSLFLWLLAPMESIFIARSKSYLIPWNAYNISRIVVVAICILTTLADSIFCIYRYSVLDDHLPVSEFSSSLISLSTLVLLYTNTCLMHF